MWSKINIELNLHPLFLWKWLECFALSWSHHTHKKEHGSTWRRTNRNKEHRTAEPNEIQHMKLCQENVMVGRRAEQQTSKYLDLSLNKNYFDPLKPTLLSFQYYCFWTTIHRTFLKAHRVLNKTLEINRLWITFTSFEWEIRWYLCMCG